MSDTDFDLTSEGTLNFEKQTAVTGPAATCPATVGTAQLRRSLRARGPVHRARFNLGPELRKSEVSRNFLSFRVAWGSEYRSALTIGKVDRGSGTT